MAQDGKLTYEQLCDLAVDWCQAWCQRDLDRIMSHYTDDVALNSPNVAEPDVIDCHSPKALLCLQPHAHASQRQPISSPCICRRRWICP